MTTPSPSSAHDPECDLLLERVVDVPVDLVWQAWTDPEHLKHWFVPKPWGVAEVEMDLRPGGMFRTVFQDEEGNRIDNGAGCYLEVQEPNRLVWTSALGPDYRPQPPADPASGEFQFTAELTFEAVGDGTRYLVRAIHATPEAAQAHEEMGFSGGWGLALDQLVEHMKALAGR